MCPQFLLEMITTQMGDPLKYISGVEPLVAGLCQQWEKVFLEQVIAPLVPCHWQQQQISKVLVAA